MITKVEDFNYDNLKFTRQKRPRGNPKGNKAKYATALSAFDIETTTIEVNGEKQAIMYIWQFQLEEQTIIGRYWSEFFDFLEKLKEKLGELTLVIWDHNLSFEFQFLKGLYDFEEDEVFCMESRKVLKCTMFDHFEFRCSYLHSNMSLAKFIESVGAEHKKLDGKEFNYSITRYPWTPLTEREMEYCVNDVRGLVEAIRIEMEKDCDTLYTIPLTSTGYPRRECKRAMKGFNHKQLLSLLPDAYIYRMLREAFRGGNTHGSRFYANVILSQVKSYDRSSSYPDVLVNYKYPMRKFYHEGRVTAKRLKDLIFRLKKACLIRIALWDVELINIFDGAPYLSRDKCRNIVNGVFDNGRILSADYLETTVTDIDFKIIIDHYKWSASDPYDVATSSYGYLPDPYRETVKEFYRLKTELKGQDEYFYTKAKNKLNGLYGMGAQDPCKDSIKFMDGEYVQMDEPIEDMIERNNRKAFLSYAWGVWCTAHARACLQRAIDRAGDQFVYCDTDSVKVLGDIDLTDINEEYQALSEQNGAYADDPKGKRHYMGVWEDDGDYIRFSHMGAKKYVYEDAKDGQLHITIAGVNKKKGANELKCIENFKEGFTFFDAGGTESRYNDNVDLITDIDGHAVRVTDNVVISDSTYTIGLTAEYRAIIEGAADIKYSDIDINGYYKVKK